MVGSILPEARSALTKLILYRFRSHTRLIKHLYYLKFEYWFSCGMRAVCTCAMACIMYTWLLVRTRVSSWAHCKIIPMSLNVNASAISYVSLVNYRKPLYNSLVGVQFSIYLSPEGKCLLWRCHLVEPPHRHVTPSASRLPRTVACWSIIIICLSPPVRYTVPGHVSHHTTTLSN